MIILKNATVVNFEPPEVLENMDVVIHEERIVEVKKDAASKYKKDTGTEFIDLNGKIVMPGLVCGHNHFYSGLARGILAKIPPSNDFISILKNLWWRLDRAIDEEILYYSGMVCALDAIKCGTTAVIDHHASPAFVKGSLNVLKSCFEKTGLRGLLCYEITDRNGKKELEAGLNENLDFIKNSEDHKLVKGMIGGHAPFTVPDEMLKSIGQAMKDLNTGFHIHVAEDKYDVAHSHHQYGLDIIDRLNQFGVLNDRSILAHGVHLKLDEIEKLNASGCYLAHNPRSNMNNNVGYFPYLENVKNGLMGTDGIGSDMFEELKVAYFKHKDMGGAFWPNDFIKMLHRNNKVFAKYFDQMFGKVAVGHAADIAILDYTPSTPLNSDNIGGHMVFGMSSNLVETVIIAGKIVLRDRKFNFDTTEIYKNAQKAAQKLWDNMDQLDV